MRRILLMLTSMALVAMSGLAGAQKFAIPTVSPDTRRPSQDFDVATAVSQKRAASRSFIRDEQGRRVFALKDSGDVMTYHYHDGKLTKQTSTFGRVVVWTWTTGGKVQAISSNRGSMVRLDYRDGAIETLTMGRLGGPTQDISRTLKGLRNLPRAKVDGDDEPIMEEDPEFWDDFFDSVDDEDYWDPNDDGIPDCLGGISEQSPVQFSVQELIAIGKPKAGWGLCPTDASSCIDIICEPDYQADVDACKLQPEWERYQCYSKAMDRYSACQANCYKAYR